VVLPLAIPGLVTGIILTAGRVFGEAAVLLFTAGTGDNTGLDFASFSLSDAHSAWNPFRPATTLSVYIWRLNSDGLGAFKTEIINGTAAILIATVLLFNLGARLLGRLLTRKLTAA
jgi:phosphate transport system permease protein